MLFYYISKNVGSVIMSHTPTFIVEPNVSVIGALISFFITEMFNADENGKLSEQEFLNLLAIKETVYKKEVGVRRYSKRGIKEGD